MGAPGAFFFLFFSFLLLAATLTIFACAIFTRARTVFAVTI